MCSSDLVFTLPAGQSVQSSAPAAENLPAAHGECCWPLWGGHANPAAQGLQGSGVEVGEGVRLGVVLGGAEVEPVGVPVPLREAGGVLEAEALSEMEGVPEELLVAVREGVPEPVCVGVGEELSEGRAAPTSKPAGQQAGAMALEKRLAPQERHAAAPLVEKFPAAQGNWKAPAVPAGQEKPAGHVCMLPSLVPAGQ